MNKKENSPKEEYKMACDDADPESQCISSAQGTSVDETYQNMVAHKKAVHPEKINSLTPEQLQQVEKKMRDHVGKIQQASQDTQNSEKGVIGYAILWWLGVPASLLFIIFLLRGCD